MKHTTANLYNFIYVLVDVINNGDKKSASLRIDNKKKIPKLYS